MTNYSHGTGLKSQLASGVELAISFSTVSDILKRSTCHIFHETWLWWGSPYRHIPEDTVVLPFISSTVG